MNEHFMKRLRDVAKRRMEIEHLLAQPETVQDHTVIKRLGREYRESGEVVTLWHEYEKTERELMNTRSILETESDSGMLELAKTEIAELLERLHVLDESIKKALIPPEASDHADAILEIRAGVGGDEAGLFAAELGRMYTRYAERKNWKVTLISLHETKVGSLKEGVFEITGDGVYRLLSLESGVHRVQRIPTTESQGRIHTSTATVAVLPKAEELDVKIDEADVRTDVFHASGAGGQNVNKVATAIRLTHIPTGIVVTCQNERSQFQNRTKAMEVLRSRLWDMELRKQSEAESADRKSQIRAGDRSDKVRTYNYPQNRVTDHRINFASHNLHRLLDGELDDFIEALSADQQMHKLAAVSE